MKTFRLKKWDKDELWVRQLNFHGQDKSAEDGISKLIVTLPIFQNTQIFSQHSHQIENSLNSFFQDELINLRSV